MSIGYPLFYDPKPENGFSHLNLFASIVISMKSVNFKGVNFSL